MRFVATSLRFVCRWGTLLFHSHRLNTCSSSPSLSLVSYMYILFHVFPTLDQKYAFGKSSLRQRNVWLVLWKGDNHIRDNSFYYICLLLAKLFFFLKKNFRNEIYYMYTIVYIGDKPVCSLLEGRSPMTFSPQKGKMWPLRSSNSSVRSISRKKKNELLI